MKRKPSWVWVALGCVALFFVAVAGMSSAMRSLIGAGAGEPSSHVALVSLQGAISDSASRSLLGGGSGGSREFISDLEEAVRDPAARAIVIRINSPGGSAAASQEMFQAVMRARRSKKIYASMGDVAASGGYYIASACDKIFANPATLTGSIGVISQFLNYGQLLRKVGLDQATIKSGKFKDAGSPSRPLTPDEKVLFQAMNRDIYEQFVDDVVVGRKSASKGAFTKARLLPLADGRVFTGRQAQRVGLIDALGGLHEATQEAGRAGGIAGEVRLRDVGPSGGLLGGLLGASAAQGAAKAAGESFGRSLGVGLAEEAKARLEDVAPAPRL